MIMLALKILVALISLALILVKDWSKEKEPFDKEKKAFSFKKDYWPFRNDNVFAKTLGGGLGAICSNEVAIPIINKFLDWPELAEGVIDLTSVAISTLAVSYIINKIFTSD